MKNKRSKADAMVFLLGIEVSVVDTFSTTYLLHSITHSLTPWSRILSEKLTGPHLVRKFPAFYGT